MMRERKLSVGVTLGRYGQRIQHRGASIRVARSSRTSAKEPFALRSRPDGSLFRHPVAIHITSPDLYWAGIITTWVETTLNWPTLSLLVLK